MTAVPRVPPEGGPSPDPLRTVRVPFIQRATFVHDGRGEEVFLVDLGLDGAFVERAAPLPVGALVLLSFRLPGNEIPVEVQCRVAWWHAADAALVSKSLPAGLGLHFVEVTEADRQRLRRHLVEYLAGAHGARRFHRPWPRADDGAEP